MAPGLQRQTAAALAAVGGGGADEVLQHFRPLRPCERLGGDGDKLVDRRMLLKLLVANPPHVGEPAVPQLQPAVGGEHADRLEKIVERRRLDAAQRVARTGVVELLGPVLEDDEKPASRAEGEPSELQALIRNTYAVSCLKKK